MLVNPKEYLVRARREGWALGGFARADSDLRLAAIGRLRQALVERPDLFNLYELMGLMEDAIRQATLERIELLGSAQRGRSTTL